ncbi:MAG TPA: alpha/beta hydrolase [Ktedonobacteraceae bacterium]|nr:alpha/beta hydrolase [Ktedonobacteraceae bacterium]
MKSSGLLSLVFLLLFLVACSSGSLSQSTSVPTPHPTPTPGITPTPTIPSVPSRLVHFSTADHIQLAGLLYGSGKTAVICSHELRTSKIIWGDSGIPQRLALRGYLVLAYDFRGNGDSAGQFDSSKLDVDLRAAIAFVRQQGATRIVLLGSSMGGTATLKVAASEPVSAVITLSAPQEFGINVSDTDVKAIHAPKLFVNSQDDTFSSDTMHMYTIASPPKEIHLYSGSAHGTAIFDENDGDLTQRILNFITHYAPAS